MRRAGPVVRGQRPVRDRRPALRRRGRRADRGGPDDDQLGGVQEPPRHRQDRPRWCSARGPSRRCRMPPRPPAAPPTTSASGRCRGRRTARSPRGSAATTSSAINKNSDEQGGRAGLARLVRRRVGLRAEPGRHLARRRGRVARHPRGLRGLGVELGRARPGPGRQGGRRFRHRQRGRDRPLRQPATASKLIDVARGAASGDQAVVLRRPQPRWAAARVAHSG